MWIGCGSVRCADVLYRDEQPRARAKGEFGLEEVALLDARVKRPWGEP
jgi:hypothetical protein